MAEAVAEIPAERASDRTGAPNRPEPLAKSWRGHRAEAVAVHLPVVRSDLRAFALIAPAAGLSYSALRFVQNR